MNFYLRRPIYDKNKKPLIKFIVYDKLSIKKTDSNCPLVIFIFSSFFLLHFDTILHIAVISIFIKRSHFFFFNYFQFYASRKALVIKTNFSLLYPIQITERDRSYMNEQSTYKFFSSLYFFLLIFQHVALFSSFLLFFLFFPRRSVPLIVACLFLFFHITSFNSSIFLCPFRWYRVVMLKNCRLR